MAETDDDMTTLEAIGEYFQERQAIEDSWRRLPVPVKEDPRAIDPNK